MKGCLVAGGGAVLLAIVVGLMAMGMWNGIVSKDEKFRGIFEFCIWYEQLLRREGHGNDESPL